MKKRSAKYIEKNRLIKIAQIKRQNKEKHKANNIKKQRGKNLLYQIFLVVNRHFPDLYERLRELEDCRRKSEYELIELLVACIAKKVPAMHTIMTVSQSNSKRTIRKYSNSDYLIWIRLIML